MRKLRRRKIKQSSKDPTDTKMYSTDAEHRQAVLFPTMPYSVIYKEKEEGNPKLRQLVRTQCFKPLTSTRSNYFNTMFLYFHQILASFYMNCLVICIKMIPKRRTITVEKLQDTLSRRNCLTLVSYEPGHCSHNLSDSLLAPKLQIRKQTKKWTVSSPPVKEGKDAMKHLNTICLHLSHVAGWTALPQNIYAKVLTHST